MTPSLGKIPTVMTCKRALLGGVFLGVLATTTLAAQAAPSCEAWNTKEFGREVQRSHRGTGRVARRRRNQIVVVPPLTRAHDGPIDLIVDSTGLKILGRGEWTAHKHKTSQKRRDWRKLHIGVDAKGFIVAAELTASSRDDASTLPDLLAPLEVPIRRFTADGAYDHRSVYDRASAAGTENVVIVIPPRRSALSAGPTDGPWAQREASLQRIRKVGRREWQKESGYRQQARVENSFFRYKSVFGGGLKARHSKAQRREAAIGCHILNRMAELGRPSSYALGR